MRKYRANQPGTSAKISGMGLDLQGSQSWFRRLSVSDQPSGKNKHISLLRPVPTNLWLFDRSAAAHGAAHYPKPRQSAAKSELPAPALCFQQPQYGRPGKPTQSPIKVLPGFPPGSTAFHKYCYIAEPPLFRLLPFLPAAPSDGRRNGPDMPPEILGQSGSESD